jgi:hypothetical protein
VGILIFKGLTARRLYKSLGVKGLTDTADKPDSVYIKLYKSHLYPVTLDRAFVSCLIIPALLTSAKSCKTCVSASRGTGVLQVFFVVREAITIV